MYCSSQPASQELHGPPTSTFMLRCQCPAPRRRSSCVQQGRAAPCRPPAATAASTASSAIRLGHHHQHSRLRSESHMGHLHKKTPCSHKLPLPSTQQHTFGKGVSHGPLTMQPPCSHRLRLGPVVHHHQHSSLPTDRACWLGTFKVTRANTLCCTPYDTSTQQPLLLDACRMGQEADVQRAHHDTQ
jgi:hypothetical protein